MASRTILQFLGNTVPKDCQPSISKKPQPSDSNLPSTTTISPHFTPCCSKSFVHSLVCANPLRLQFSAYRSSRSQTGAAINGYNERALTPLLSAIICPGDDGDRFKTIQLLLQHGASPEPDCCLLNPSPPSRTCGTYHHYTHLCTRPRPVTTISWSYCYPAGKCCIFPPCRQFQLRFHAATKRRSR